MNITISEPRKLAEGQAKAVILVDNFLELAVLEDRQARGEKFKIVSVESAEYQKDEFEDYFPLIRLVKEMVDDAYESGKNYIRDAEPREEERL